MQKSRIQKLLSALSIKRRVELLLYRRNWAKTQGKLMASVKMARLNMDENETYNSGKGLETGISAARQTWFNGLLSVRSNHF